jgi:ParB/RepB/Spo0J family partition protein
MQGDLIQYTIQDISVADIIFPKDDLRSQIAYEDLDELARSIRSVGLLNPISVRKIDNKYELIAGYRRLKACEICGFAVIPARILISNDTQADLQKLHENMFREEVNPIDEGNFFKRLLIKNNWRIVDLAVQIHKSAAYVSKRIQLTDSDPLVVQALKDGQINISVADELIKIDDPDTRARLLHYAIKSGVTVDTVRSWRVQYDIDNVPAGPVYQGDQPPGLKGSDLAEQIVTKFNEQVPPTRKIEERVIESRPCYACSRSFDTRDIYVLYLCPDCKSTIEFALHPNSNNDVLKEGDPHE